LLGGYVIGLRFERNLELPMLEKYRLYVDESGTADYSTSAKIRDKYLCLLGIIAPFSHYEAFVEPQWNQLRQMFSRDSDPRPIFHFTDVVRRKGNFSKLYDRQVEQRFRSEFYNFLKNSSFTICCIVIDKNAHLDKYGKQFARNAYHFCLEMLLERYTKFLSDKNGRGDIIIEGRSKREDNLLESEFQKLYERGTDFVRREEIQKRITSKNLKFARKQERVAGLEISDMLAIPVKLLTLREYGRIAEIENGFVKQIAELAKPKIRAKPRHEGVIQGYGIKLL